MKQWREVKSRHRDALVFFRVGDFYELFYQDAEEGSRLLGLTLTSRNNGSSRAPLAGVPVKALDEYLQRLVKAGRRVAICEQVEDASEAEGIVRREVVETVTPGTVLHDTLLKAERNNFLVAVAPEDGGSHGVAALDLSTGELVVRPVASGELAAELGRLEPSELLLPRSFHNTLPRVWRAEVGKGPGHRRTARGPGCPAAVPEPSPPSPEAGVTTGSSTSSRPGTRSSGATGCSPWTDSASRAGIGAWSGPPGR